MNTSQDVCGVFWDSAKTATIQRVCRNHAGLLLARISHELRFELAADCAEYADGALSVFAPI